MVKKSFKAASAAVISMTFALLCAVPAFAVPSDDNYIIDISSYQSENTEEYSGENTELEYDEYSDENTELEYDEYSDDYSDYSFDFSDYSIPDYSIPQDYLYDYSFDYSYDYSFDYSSYDYSSDSYDSSYSYNVDRDIYPEYYDGSSKKSTSSAVDDAFFKKDDYYKSEHVYFYDESGRFSSSQKEKIQKLLEDTSDKIGFDLGLYAGGEDYSDSKIEKIVTYGSKRLFTDSSYDGTAFLFIDLDGQTNAYDCLATYREAFLYYTDSTFGDRIGKIVKAMEKYFPAGGETIVTSDIIKGLEEYCAQLIEYKNKGTESWSFCEDDINGGYYVAKNGGVVKRNTRPYRYWWAGLGIGLAIGAIVALCVRAGIKKKYKFKSSASASEYTSKEKMFMRNSEDVFLGTHVSKVRIESSSGGGGHGGGGFGGGHGGGGFGGSHR